MQIKARQQALKITLIYAAVAGGWILITDELVDWLIHDPEMRAKVSLLKGWFFVFFTAILLHQMVRRYLRSWAEAVEQRLRAEATEAAGIEKLRLSEERYRALFVYSLDAIVTADPISGKFTSGNPAALKLYGVPSEEAFLQCAPFDLSPERQPDGRLSQEKAPELMAQAMREGWARFEWTHRRLGGEEFFAEVLITRMQQAETTYLQATVRDITERKKVAQAEASRHESEQRYRALFEHMNEGVACCRMLFAQGRADDFIYLEVNEMFTTLTGLKDVTGKRVSEVIPGLRESDPELFEIYGRVATSGKPERQERFVVALQMWFSISAYGMGQDLFVVVFDVITARKQVEVALHKSEDRLHLAQEAAKAGTWEWNLRTNQNFWSNEIWDLYGLPPNTAPASYEMWRDAILPADRAAAEQAVQQAARSGQEINAEWRVRTTDGLERWLMSRGKPVRDHNGSVESYLGIVIDITEHKRTELRLQAALAEAQRFRTAMDEVHACVYMKDVQSRYTYANQPALEMLGCAAALLPGKEDADFFAPGTAARLRQIDGRVFKGEQTVEEVEVPSQDGRRRIYWEIKTPIYADAERRVVTGLLGISTDITERKLMEEMLQHSRNLLAESERMSRLGGWEIDLATRKLTWTESVFELHELNQTRQPSLAEAIQFYSSASRPIIERAVQRAIEAGETFDVELQIITAKGRPCDVHAIGHADLARGRVFGFIQDITERKRAEEQLHLQFSALSAAANAIVITNGQGRIEWVNPAFTRLTGYRADEAVGNYPRVLKSGQHAPGFYASMWATVLAGNVWHGELVNRRKDGRLYDEEMTITPVRDGEGRIAHFVAIKQDISERRQLESRLQQAQKMEAIGKLAGGIAHDFNNILAAIIGYTNLLQQDAADNVAAQSDIAEILKATERAKELVRQILTFSRQREQKRELIQLDTVVKEATKFLRASLPANLKIELNLAANTPAVLADPTQIYQVTMNLATNALHALEGRTGQLTINLESCEPDAAAIKLHPELKPIPYTRLVIADTGHGMEAQTMARIFEPFFTTKPVGKGTGLGLAVVYGIMQSHEGVITVESRVGVGTTFTLYFPAKCLPGGSTKAPLSQIAPGRGQRILVVDDEPTLTSVLRRLLTRLNYQVTCTNSAPEALRLFCENPGAFDLVITDLTMPEMNGLELGRQLHQLRSDLPIVLASGYTAELDAEKLAAAGINGVLDKPISLETLAGSLGRALNRVAE
jgi:PAS domain S-box-containing protein